MDDSASRPPERPKLRLLDVVRVVDSHHGLVTVVRDGEGIGESVVVPPPLDRLLELLDGRRTVEQVATLASRSSGRVVSTEQVAVLVLVLHRAFLLDDPRHAKRRLELEAEFSRAEVRTAVHAGTAYHADPIKLRAFITSDCMAAATKSGVAADPTPATHEAVALIAPHMDLWRAARGYGHAYGALASGLPDGADTFLLLGTCHAGMRAPFALTTKTFETPLGPLVCDREIAKSLAAHTRFDVFSDEYQHKAEHSIEFQAVFLRHLLGHERARDARVVPILCGLGRAQARRSDPVSDLEAESFVSKLADLVAARGDRVVVIAGADLSHMGPRFGDPSALDESEREALHARDGESLERALEGDALGFFEHTTSDLDERRVCGVGPIYTLLRLLPALGQTASRLLHYAQHVDPDEGSIVSHASASFVRRTRPRPVSYP